MFSFPPLSRAAPGRSFARALPRAPSALCEEGQPAGGGPAGCAAGSGGGNRYRPGMRAAGRLPADGERENRPGCAAPPWFGVPDAPRPGLRRLSGADPFRTA